MKTYIGAKLLKAKEMNIFEASEVLKRPIPIPENKEEEGYLVEYEEGFKSWSPKSVFEKCYREVNIKE